MHNSITKIYLICMHLLGFMFNKIKEFWKEKLKLIDKIYFFLILVMICLSIYVAYIESYPINKINKNILEDKIDLEELEGAKDYDEHLFTLFTIYYATGRSLDSQREEIIPDSMGETSASLNLAMQNMVYETCKNINTMQKYLNDSLDCSKVWGIVAFFDNTELKKLRMLQTELRDVITDYKQGLKGLESQKQGLSERRNFLYVILVTLTGIGIAINYILKKIN